MNCDKCGAPNSGQNSFCVSCGSPVSLPPKARGSVPPPEVIRQPLAPRYDPPADPTRKPSRPVAIVVISALAVGLGFAGVGLYQEWNEARLERLAQENLSEAFGEAILADAVTNCGSLRDVVENIPEERIAAYADSLEGLLDPRQALVTAQTADFPAAPYLPAYRDNVEREAAMGLTVLFQTSDRDDIAPPEQKARWKNQWIDFALAQCGALGQYESNVALLAEADRIFDRVREMAANAPWYPEGFSEYSSGLAYRWSTDEGGWPCNNCSFWKMTVLTKNGCPYGVYGEINILRRGSVVGWTNDLIDYLGPGETAILNYVRYPYRSALVGELVELSCY